MVFVDNGTIVEAEVPAETLRRHAHGVMFAIFTRQRWEGRAVVGYKDALRARVTLQRVRAIMSMGGVQVEEGRDNNGGARWSARVAPARSNSNGKATMMKVLDKLLSGLNAMVLRLRPDKTTVSLGAISVEGRRVPLEMVIRRKPRRHVPSMFTDSVDVLVPFPATYPNTHLRAKHKQLVWIHTEGPLPLGKQYMSPTLKTRLSREFGVNDKTPVFELSFFYGLNPSSREYMTSNERVTLRGIARRAMCRLLHMVAEEHPEEAKHALFLLVASGNVHDDKMPRSFNGRNMRAVRRSIVRNIHNEEGRREVMRAEGDELYNLANERAQQRDLERMYTRAFGVRPVYRKAHDMTDMAARFVTALQKCSRPQRS